jgi:hypothetical protein
MLSFISSNKWFRAGYGKKLRAIMARATSVRTILDFHDLPVFESAIAYPMIFIAEKGLANAGRVPTLVEPSTLGPPYPDVSAVVAKFGQALASNALGIDGAWQFATSSVADRLAKMRAAGPRLGEYVKERIFLGIKTGLNEAFVIDGATRAELLAADNKSTEIIKPLGAGKDVKRWRISSRDKWLIVTEIGVDIERYPAIFRHLQQFKDSLEARTDQGNHWWELRACAYYDIFQKPKLVFPDIAPDVRFAYDSGKTYFQNTTYIIAKDDLYLLAVLNSHPVGELYKELSAQIRGGYVRFFIQYVETIPIPTASAADRAAISALAQKCLDAQGMGCLAWEKEIDERVSALYGL